MNITLSAGGDITRPVHGTFFYMQSAAGAVRIEFELMGGERSSYDISDRSFQIEMASPIRNVRLQDLSGASNALVIHTGFGRFIPSNDGQHVVLDGGTATIEVHTAAGQPLEVVGVNGDPLPVSGPLTDAELRATPVPVTPPVSASVTAGAVVTGSGTIAANPAREGVIIKVPKANTGVIATGAAGTGLQLDPGDLVRIPTRGAITISATVPADTWSFLEY